MLDSMRSAAGTWAAKILLLLLVLSFAVWGISSQLTGGFGNNAVIQAGGTSVSAQDYRLAYDRQLSLYGRQFGQQISRQQAAALGIDQQVLAQLVSGAVLDEQARKMGLGLSRDRLAALTAEDPAFHGPDGRFNRQQFDYVLREVGMRPEDYLNNRAQAAVRQQISEAVAEGVRAPDTFLRAVALYQGEDRTVEYIALPQSLVEPIEDPKPEDLSAWFDERKQSYAAPEYRKIAYVKLTAEEIADPSVITQEQIQQDYEANKARYTTPETRTIDQLVFATPEAAQAAAQRIEGGATFEEIVSAEGKKIEDVRLGSFTKDRIPDQAVADAAFSLQQNEVSDPVQGSFGTVLVRVTEIKPEAVRPLAEVAEEIRRDLALSEASSLLLDVHDRYEDARASGDNMQDAASRLRLNMVTVDIDRNGQRPDGTVVEDLPESQQLISAAFEADANVENPPLNLGTDGFLFYEVMEVTPARDRTLEEVRDRVVADWKAEQVSSRLSAKAEELQKRLADGADLDQIASELSLEKQTKRGLTRQSQDADLGEDGAQAVFGVAQGGVGNVRAPDGRSYLLFKVTEVTAPVASGPEGVPEQLRQTFATGLANDLLDQLVVRLQGEYGVEMDQAAISRALAF